MPRMRVSTAVVVNPGVLRKERTAKCKFFKSCSSDTQPRTSLACSCTLATLPNCRNAA